MRRLMKGIMGTLLLTSVIGTLAASHGQMAISWAVAPSDSDTTMVEYGEAPPIGKASSQIVGTDSVRPLTIEERMAADTMRRSAFPEPSKTPVVARIHLLARTYGDSIVLRWAAGDYVTQRKMNLMGVDIVRYDLNTGEADTIAHQVKPWTLEELRAEYPETDSIAMMAMELMYGDANFLKSDQTESMGGTVGAMVELYQDQMTRHAFTILVSEWRRDLAERMAMRVVDRKVQPGHTYEYILRPSEEDTTSSILMGAGHIESILNEPYVPDPFQVAMGDTVTGPYSIRLWWENKNYSSYEIYRRRTGEQEWTHLNERPYMVMPDLAGDEVLDCYYKDVLPGPGDYEYRVRAHDAFGDLTAPSPIHKVHLADLAAPGTPQIKQLIVNRADSTDLMKDVSVTFHIQAEPNDSDRVGFLPIYYHRKLTDNNWRKLSAQLIPPNDTVFTVDVTGLTTGMVAVGACDKAGNVSYSMPLLLTLQDLKAPDAPRNLKAVANAEQGTITLTWESDEEDIEYYEVAAVNDTTHKWMLISQGKLTRKTFVDTVATDVNQKYIYYKVRAIDYSTNTSEYTDVLQVIRPSTLPPSPAHLEQSAVKEDGIYLRWGLGNDQQISHHELLRRLENQEEWMVIARWDADSVNALGGLVDYVDRPTYTREARYVYAVRSYALNGQTTTTLGVSLAWEGDIVFEWPIRLFGIYNAEEGYTRIAWESEGKLPYMGEWYFCIFRKGKGDAHPRFFISAPADSRDKTDYLLRPGEEADYYVTIQFKDGRRSLPSNTITVKAPEK